MHGGQGKITNATPAPQILATLRGNWAGQRGMYGDINATENEDILTALGEIEMFRRVASRAVETEDPRVVGNFLLPATNGLLAMGSIGNPGEQQIELTEAMLSDPRMYEATLVGGNDVNLQKRLAFASAAQDFFTSTSNRQASTRRDLEKPVFNGVPLVDFLDVSFTDTEGDVVSSRAQFTFTVNRERVRASLAAPGTTPTDAQINLAVQDIISRATPAMQEVNRNVRSAAHIEAWTQPTIDEDTVDYPLAARSEGWISYFFELNAQ